MTKARPHALKEKFRPGDAVRVLDAYPLGHVRTPFYIRGKTGTVERLCGAFPNPEELAQMRDGLPALYEALEHYVDAHRESRPDAVAIRCQGQTVTYGEYAANVDRAGNAFRSLGLTID